MVGINFCCGGEKNNHPSEENKKRKLLSSEERDAKARAKLVNIYFKSAYNEAQLRVSLFLRISGTYIET